MPLEHHFRDRPRARELFEGFRPTVEEEGGPVRLSVSKTRISLITRITFAAVILRKNHLRAHILLLRKLDSARFVRVNHVHPYWAHVFEVRDEADFDDELRAWLREACRVGVGR